MQCDGQDQTLKMSNNFFFFFLEVNIYQLENKYQTLTWLTWRKQNLQSSQFQVLIGNNQIGDLKLTQWILNSDLIENLWKKKI